MKEISINKSAKLSENLTSSSVASLSHSSKLNGLRLTPHFTLGELCKTSAKTADGRSATQGDALLAKNIPSHVHIENLKRLCGWLEMLRDEWNRRYGDGDDPIIINSGYRSEEVNKAIGGVKGSNHLTGCAADIRVAGMEQALRYAVILLDISDESREDFDELLIERSPKGGYWLHFAVRPPSQENRRKVRFIQT
jgi:uncharacterized protein YcbK (DUF882 family)